MWVKIGHTNPVPPLRNPGHVWPTCCMPVPDECQLCQMHAKSGPNLFADWVVSEVGDAVCRDD